MATVYMDGDLTISEIMYQSPEGNRALPQWIELYNSSTTHSINLDNWQLTIDNIDRTGLGGHAAWHRQTQCVHGSTESDGSARLGFQHTRFRVGSAYRFLPT